MKKEINGKVFWAVLIIVLVAFAVIAGVFKSNKGTTTLPTINSTDVNTPTLIDTTTSPVATPIQPSERSLKIAAEMFVYSGEVGQKKMMEGYTSKEEAIKGWAIYYDKNPGEAAIAEAAIQSYLINSVSKPTAVPYYNPSINCTTNTIGNYTYTNCY
jgi:hypothetical protein